MPVLLHHNTTSRSSFPNYNNATPTILPETRTTSSIRNIMIMMHETMTTTMTTTTLLEETKDALVFLYHYSSKCQSGEDEECTTIIPMEFHRSKKAIHLVVQEGVQVLPDNACKDVRPLVSVVLPASLQTMGHGVFSQCENLQHVTFSTTSQSQSQLEVIGDDAFGDCNALTTLELPSSVKSIGKRAFYQSGLTCMVLPPNIKVIPDHAFHGCKHLTNVTLPTHVTHIGKKAFSSCLHLQELFYDGTHLTHLDFQGYRLGVDGLQTIRKFLSQCQTIQSLSLRNVMISRQPANRTGKLHQDDLSVVLDMVSKCPTLTKLDLSYNDFTHDVLPWLASTTSIPSHLRHLLLYRIMQDDNSYDPQACLTYIMDILKQHSNLVLWTEPIINMQDDKNKMMMMMMMMNHCLDWNQYIGGNSNKGWMILLPDAIWPLLLERLYQLDLPPPPLQQHQQQRSRTTSLRTSSTNLVYHLLRQNPQVLFASSS